MTQRSDWLRSKLRLENVLPCLLALASTPTRKENDMEALNLHKAMAMGKGYPTKVEGSGKDPAPTPAKPSGDAKNLTRMKSFEAKTPKGGM